MAKLERPLTLPLLRIAFVLSGFINRSTPRAALGFRSQPQRPSVFGHQRQRVPSIQRRVEQVAPSRVTSDDAAAKTSLRRRDVFALQVATSPIVFDEEERPSTRQTQPEGTTRRNDRGSPLGLALPSLSDALGGSGRAAVVWDCLRAGVDPNLHYGGPDEEGEDRSDDPIARAWIAATSSSASASPTSQRVDASVVGRDGDILLGRRHGQGLGRAAWKKLQKIMRDCRCSRDDLQQLSGHEGVLQQGRDAEEIHTIENSVAFLSHLNVSPDGTTKLLLNMREDGLEVESVIIPWVDKGFSTLCVS